MNNIMYKVVAGAEKNDAQIELKHPLLWIYSCVGHFI